MNRFVAFLSRLSILRFAVIGALGMPVDWGVMQLFLHWGAPRDCSRLIAWFCAATFTWLGNRYFTFRDQRARGAGMAKEWLRFLGANAIGGAANVGSFLVLTHFAPAPWNNTNIAFVIGVLVGLVFNFTLSKKLVFKGPI